MKIAIVVEICCKDSEVAVDYNTTNVWIEAKAKERDNLEIGRSCH